MLHYLNKPYPLYERKWVLIIAISLFVSIFLVVFQPFGLQNLRSEYKLLLLAGYGAVTFLVLILDMIIFPFIFPSCFREERWTILKQVLWVSWIVLSISLGNYFYSVLFQIFPGVGWKGIAIFAGFTFAIAILPVAVVTMLNHTLLLKRNLASSGKINESLSIRHRVETDQVKPIVVFSESGKLELETDESSLLFLSSEGNYVNVWYETDNKISRKLVRNTLKEVEKQLHGANDMFRCHRAFIVNLDHVNSVSGNSQGYRLTVDGVEEEVPVSRSYVRSFREKMESSNR